ncbi:MAG TPA: hypothetical protein PLW86_01755 [Rhodocyclaceae bacterium]|nr:hypothetical protein [Rhodocyclaceae bacterium]
MKRGWIERNLGWIRDDLRHMFDSLTRSETWITLSMLAGFGLIGWGILRLALQSDTMLRSLHPATTLCREQDNLSITVIFFLGLFFVLSALASVGEYFNYLEAKRHKSMAEARRSLRTVFLIGIAALVLGGGALLYLEGRCG